MCFAPIEPSDETDQTTAIQAELTLNAVTELKAGIFKYSNLTLPEGHQLKAQGEGTILKQIAPGIGITVNTYSVIDNLRMQSAHAGATVGIYGENVKIPKFRDVHILGYSVEVGRGYTEALFKFVSSGGSNTYGAVLDHCHGQLAKGHALKIVGGCAGYHVLGGRYQANDGFGLYAQAPGGVECSLRDVIIEGNIGGAAYVDNWYASEVVGHFENSGGQVTPLMRLGINGACKTLTLRNSSFGAVAAEHAIDLGGGGANLAITIANNTFAGCSKAAVLAYALWHSAIMDNEFSGKHLELKAYSQCKNLSVRDYSGDRVINTGVHAY